MTTLLTPQKLDTTKGKLSKPDAGLVIYQFMYQSYLKSIYKPIIELAKTVYQELSWGWNESVFREALYFELSNHGYRCGQELTKPIYYKGNQLSNVNARLDLLVKKGNLELIIELKADAATKNTMIKAEQQCRRYLTLTKLKYGMVINFPEREDKKIETILIAHNQIFNLNAIPLPLDNKNKVRCKKSQIVKEKKPKSAVMLYLYDKDNRSQAQSRNPLSKSSEITSLLSKQWKLLSETEKQPWVDKTNNY